MVSLIGATVAEAYQILLKSAVVIQLIPFLYLFLGLVRLPGTGFGSRLAGVVGAATTAFGMRFLPVASGRLATVAAPTVGIAVPKKRARLYKSFIRSPPLLRIF